MKWSLLQFYLEIDILLIHQRRKFVCSVANKDAQKHRGIKHRVKVTNDGDNNNQSAKNQQTSKCTLASVNRSHGCSTTDESLIQASSIEPIFNTTVQNGSKPDEASFGHHYPEAAGSWWPLGCCRPAWSRCLSTKLGLSTGAAGTQLQQTPAALHLFLWGTD